MIKYSRPSRLLKLILEHGEEAIFEAGIKHLGFPGTWIDNQNEVAELENKGGLCRHTNRKRTK